jgi:hypothetical protein
VIDRLVAAARRRAERSLDDALAAQRGHWTGGPTLVLSFDVELRADCEALPEILTRLARRRIVASFACIGAHVSAYPDAHRGILAGGHEVLNHTDTHPSHDELGTVARFDALDDAELEREVASANAKLAAIGATPRGFRSPHFGAMHTPRVYPILRRLGIAYSSSTVASRDAWGGAPHERDGIWEFPLTGCPRHRGALLDSWHCTTAPDAAHRGRDLAATYQRALDAVVRHGAFASVYWDPRVVLLPEYDAALEAVAAFARRGRVARYVDLLPAAP